MNRDLAYLAFNLLDAFALEHCMRSVHDQFAKVADAVTLPILDVGLELQNGFSTLQGIDNVVGSNQHRAGCGFTFDKGVLLFVVQLSLFAKFLCSDQQRAIVE